MSEEKPSQEPFLLSMLPFAGLGLLLVLALVWGYLPGRGPGAPAATDDTTKTVIDTWNQMESVDIPITDSDFTLGPSEAPVTIVEFSDFQCPFCRAGAEEVKKVLSAHPDEVRVVFKNFPLDTACSEDMPQQLHPLACRAAVVARCAGEEGAERFWKTHDAFFAAPELTEAVLARIPTDLSLPAEAFERCLASDQTLTKVKEDIRLGRKLSVAGTPVFFVNGRAATDYRDGILLRLVEHILAGDDES